MESQTRRAPGVCIPWEGKERELPPLTGDLELVRKIWEEIDLFAYIFIWHCLVSF